MELPDQSRAKWSILSCCRFFLASIVVCRHLQYISKPWPVVAVSALDAKAAVAGFLLISGYSIAASLQRDEVDFYKRRFYRIYPLYFFSLLFTVLVMLLIEGAVLLPNRAFNTADTAAIVVGNFFFLQTFLVTPIAFNGPVWSLAIEVFYYTIAPYLMKMPRWAIIALISCSMVSYSLPKHSEWGIAYLVISKFNALMWLWFWLLGFLIKRDKRLRSDTLCIGALGAFLVQFGIFKEGPFAVITYAAVFLALAVPIRFNFGKRVTAIMDYLGDASYPLYLIHFPTIILCFSVFDRTDQASIISAIVVMTLLALHGVDRFLKKRYVAPLLFRKRQALTQKLVT